MAIRSILEDHVNVSKLFSLSAIFPGLNGAEGKVKMFDKWLSRCVNNILIGNEILLDYWKIPTKSPNNVWVLDDKDMYKDKYICIRISICKNTTVKLVRKKIVVIVIRR